MLGCARKTIALVLRVVDVREAGKRIREPRRDPITHVSASQHAQRRIERDTCLDARVARPVRVSVRRHREWCARKWLHVEIQYLIVQLDVEQREIPGETELPSACADLVL